MDEQQKDILRELVEKGKTKYPLLSQEEVETILLNFAVARGADGFTDEEAEEIIKWALFARADSTILSGILNGNIEINIDPNDGLLFRVSEKGRKKVDKMIVDYLTGAPIDEVLGPKEEDNSHE